MAEDKPNPKQLPEPDVPFPDPQIGENAAAYARFLYFLRMPEGRRSVRGAYHVYWKNKNPRWNEKRMKLPPNAPDTWRNNSKQFHWQERAEQYDTEVALQDAKQWQIKNRELRHRKWELANKLMDKAETLVKHPHIQVAVPGQPGEPPRIIEPPPWNFTDAARLAADGAKLGDEAVNPDKPDQLIRVEGKHHHHKSQPSVDEFNWLKEYVAEVEPPKDTDNGSGESK